MSVMMSKRKTDSLEQPSVIKEESCVSSRYRDRMPAPCWAHKEMNDTASSAAPRRHSLTASFFLRGKSFYL